MSDRLLYDTKINLVEILSVLFGEAMAVSEDAQALRGTGSPFTGINAVVTGDNVIELGGATISTITYADIVNAEMAIPSGAIANAKWYMSNWAFRNLRNLKDDNKKPIYAGPADKMPATLDGFPVELTDGAPYANAASTCMIVFGDMNYLGFGDSTQGNRMQITNQATLTTAGNLFEKNMSALKIVQSKAIVASSDLKEAFSVIRTSA
jgi:HK97 family phage major capsid protein